MVNIFVRSDEIASRDFDFDYPVVNIGSHPENDVVLIGSAILPFHATVQLQDGQFSFFALGDISASKIAGLQLKTSPVKFSPGQRVEIDGHVLIFQKSGVDGMHVSVSGPGGEGAAINVPGGQNLAPSFTGDSPIIVNTISRQVDVQVGQTAVYELEIINAGPIVAGFSLAIQGIPSDWVKVEPDTINLFEGQHGTATISVTPPRSSESRAGVHVIDVVTSSGNYGGYYVQTQLSLNILPYYEFSVGNLTPKQQRIHWRKRSGVVKLPISNTGNSDADFNITAFDDENGCSFDFQLSEDIERSRQATLNIPAGQSTSLPIEITPLKHPIAALRNKSYHYTATAQIAQQSALSQVVSGTAVSVPLFGWWTIVVTAVLLITGLFLLLQPRIYNFQVAAGKDIIVQGDSTKLDWSVSPFATTLSISNTDQTIKRGQNSLTIVPAQSTTYDLVASNWLSGLFGLNQKRSQTVLVVPPKPVINVFDVDRTSVPEGVAINLRWSVSKADKALLTIDQVVYELKAEQFSGEQQVVLTKSSLVTLEAINASGSELRSYFIKVVPPKITVNSFIVWVRPAAAASVVSPMSLALDMTNMNGALSIHSHPVFSRESVSSSLSALDNPPDPNFPEMYVGLVPDNTADSGYRVEFYQPDRELSKGEQVMIQWDIDGADNDQLQIAPFTDTLPNRGAQPFFPQESMNFVMTAKSGKLEKIFMLPVKVFDGVPPTAPTIEFFQVTPASLLGPGKVQFAWSVSGEWTLVQLLTEDKVVADYLNPQGFKTIDVTKSGTYILTAWNGTLSSSAPKDVTVNPALIDPGLIVSSISTTRSQIGGKLDVKISFTKVPAGSTSPTGTVTVTDGSAICQIPLPADTCSLQFTTSGTKSIIANFPGDKIYQQSQSPAFAQQVIVASAEVDLIPTFYFNGGTSPISVESSTFDMDKGLHAIVEVRPKNTVLADNNGNISVSLCEQDVNEAVLMDTCTFVGAAQVKVAADTTSTQTAGYGYADIVITNFNASGVRGLLFEYSHSLNAIDPTSFFQPNIHINRPKITLSYSGCTDPYALSNCTFGLASSGASEIIFDLNTPSPSGPIRLTSLLPAPQISAFTLSSDHPAGTSEVTWACSIKVISGTYKLDCSVTGFESGNTYTVSYSYDNNDPITGTTLRNDYYMGTDPTIPFGTASFQLKVLSNTKTFIGNLTGVRVGERIHLTGASEGLISILDGSNNRIFPSTAVTLTEKSGADIFGIENEGVNCTHDPANPGIINVTAANADCYIYLKHVGSYTLTAAFAGDSYYNASTSGDLQVAVQKQTQISALLKYLNPATGLYDVQFPSSFTINTATSIRVEMTGPASNFSPADTSFPPTALADRKVLVTLSGWAAQMDTNNAPNCTLDTSTGSLVTDQSGGVYEVTITQKAIGDPADPANLTYVTAADFDVTCIHENTLGLSFAVAFSDKTDPKDSDDFAFTSQVSKSNIPITPPSTGSMTVSMKREDSSTTEMISTVPTLTIGKLHFGQLYDVSITSSSHIYPTYSYTVDYTYVYTCDLFGITCTLTGSSTSTNPSIASLNARNALVSSYSTGAKWNVDPSNFLSLETSLGTSSSTCGLNMALKTTNNTVGQPPEYSRWSLIYASRDYHVLYYTLTVTYRVTFYGTLDLTVTSNSPCTLVFDGTGSVNTPITQTNGTIAVTASSPDDLFSVNRNYAVQGLDKQAVTMTFNPAASSTINGFTGVPVTVATSLTSADISGGTSLAFADTTTFATFFSPSIDPSCTSISQVGTITLSPSFSVSQSFTSTAVYTSCQNRLRYVGNRYYKTTPPSSSDPQNQPLMSFSKHTSTVNFSSTPSFITNGAFTNVTYTNITVHVADADNPTHPSPLPGGSVKLEVYNSSNVAYNCSTASGVYTLTATGVSCDSTSNNFYTLPVTNGNTAAFSILFKPSMVSTGNYIKLTYSGDSNFNAPASPTSSAAFEVKKHAASVGFVTDPSFITNGILPQGQGNRSYTGLIIQVADADNPSHPSLIPSGTVVLQVMNSSGVAYACSGTTSAYTLTGPAVSCVNNSYTLTLDATGATSPFTLDFSSFPASTTGNYLVLSYGGDTVFLSKTSLPSRYTFASP